jgi:hypothetical protein
MDASYRGRASRSLPLLVANQAGWVLSKHQTKLHPRAFEVIESESSAYLAKE